MNKEAKIIFGVMGATILLVVLLALRQSPATTGDIIQPGTEQYAKLMNSSSHMTGKADAKVNLVEFGDFQCPACGAAHPIIKQLIDSYKDNSNFNFVFRNFPLAQHQNALPAAESAEAAGAQGKYWPMHDLIYENQSAWSENSKAIDVFVAYAQQLGLDVNKFKADVQAKKYQDFINSDAGDGQFLDVNSTPTFFLNGERIIGVSSFEDLKAKIDAALGAN